jgi:glucose-6-phosphate 1-dehydrogenase
MSRQKFSTRIIQDELCIERRVEPCALVIFGASGDLTERKLIPSLFHLYESGLLPKDFFILGVGRTPLSDASFQKKVEESLDRYAKFGPLQKARRDAFILRFHYHASDYSDIGSYPALAERIRTLDTKYGTKGNRIFYLSTPPTVGGDIVQGLGQAGLEKETAGWSRIIVEKPFGNDLRTAQSLNIGITKIFSEKQIYRIDHYLGKETVQNILIFRFANAIFEPIWNRNLIDHVQITAAESIGIEHRAGYYERSGALRDMFQNHLLQLVCLIAMEPPSSFDAESIRDERTKVMRSLHPLKIGDLDKTAIRGQYGPGIFEDKNVPGYRSEPNVDPSSATETFAALKIGIDNWRWKDVPFYVRTGKRMPERSTEISIQFKHTPFSLFKDVKPESFSPNILTVRVQPDEGITLQLHTKHPGPKLCMSVVQMDFLYEESFGIVPPESYERLILDCMAGDQTLFARNDWVELSWAYLDPLLEHWKNTPPADFPNYPAGTWGPEAADRLIEADGRRWKNS